MSDTQEEIIKKYCEQEKVSHELVLNIFNIIRMDNKDFLLNNNHRVAKIKKLIKEQSVQENKVI